MYIIRVKNIMMISSISGLLKLNSEFLSFLKLQQASTEGTSDLSARMIHTCTTTIVRQAWWTYSYACVYIYT